MLWIISRAANRRPTLMHAIGIDSRVTVCGVSIVGWSVSWHDEPIDAVVCLRCKAAA